MFITLELIKKHLNIDEYFEEDDQYLLHLALVAEEVVSKHIDDNLSDLADEEGNLPAPLQQAMLLFIGDMYQSRESVAYGSTPVEIPLSFSYILSLYKNYLNK